MLHSTHSPITVLNELHHIFPQEWQRDIWGEVRDQRKASICATAHNSIHVALRAYDRGEGWPAWCVGKTRDLAMLAIVRRAEALVTP